MSKGTQLRPMRISNEIWNPAEKRAESEGKKVVDVVREKLIEYGNRTDTKEQNK